MARALRYGFDGKGAPPADPAAVAPVEYSGGGCVASLARSGSGPLGPVRRAFAPRRLAALPGGITASPGIECDARIVPDVVYLARRFGIVVTSCFAALGHEATGEHPLGAAIDAGLRGPSWRPVEQLARSVGWKPSCAASGVAPDCARPPFRAVLYNGFPGHGDPAHCFACTGGPHIHLSWHPLGSSGEPENAARFAYEPASWIEVFETAGKGSGRDG